LNDLVVNINKANRLKRHLHYETVKLSLVILGKQSNWLLRQVESHLLLTSDTEISVVCSIASSDNGHISSYTGSRPSRTWRSRRQVSRDGTHGMTCVDILPDSVVSVRSCLCNKTCRLNRKKHVTDHCESGS